MPIIGYIIFLIEKENIAMYQNRCIWLKIVKKLGKYYASDQTKSDFGLIFLKNL